MTTKEENPTKDMTDIFREATPLPREWSLFLIHLISLLFRQDSIILDVIFYITIFISIVILGYINWLYKDYQFYKTNEGRKRITVSRRKGQDYWLYKDDHLEVIQAGDTHLSYWFRILFLPSLGLAALRLFLPFRSHSAPWRMYLIYLGINILIICFIVVYLIYVIILIRRIMVQHQEQRLLTGIWFTDPPFPELISLTLDSRAIEMPMRWGGRSKPKKLVLPFTRPSEISLGSKTFSFELNSNNPLPQTLVFLIVIIYDNTLLEI